MANQENSYTGNQGSGTGNAFFDFTFPTFSESEIKVEVDDVVKTLTTHYTVENYNATSGGKVKFTTNHIPTGTTPVRIFRQTDVDSAKAVFTAGSSLKAGEINNNFTQVLRGLQEAIGANATNRKVQNFNIADHAITSIKIKDGSIVENDLANSAVTSNKIADNAVTTTEILNGAVTRAKLEADIIDSTKLADNAVGAEHYQDGSIANDKLVNDTITGAKIADDAINTEHIADNAITSAQLATDSVGALELADGSIDSGNLQSNSVTEAKIQNDAVTIDKIADAVIVTNSEQASHSVNDTTFFTTAAAEARYFNASTGETIKNGQNFPDNDTTIATTAAINDRIIDLVDGVGGFVPVPNETSFPAANPDINNPPAGGTIVSIKAASEALPNGSTATLNGTTLTIANGRGTNSAVIITGAPSTIPSGFGFLVETTSTDHTYAFHRLVPNATQVTTVAGKATEITTVHTNINKIVAVADNETNINAVKNNETNINAVAGKATEIGRLGTADAVADMAILGTADVVADMAILGTNDVVADLNTLGTADVVADLNTLGTADVVSDMNALATTNNITAMDTCRDNIASINNCSSNISSVNTFGDQYQVDSNDPNTDGGGNALSAGDLYFNTSANELKVYNGSAWQGGVTATGNFATTTGNTFTGDNTYNDGVKAKFGTGSDLEIYHNSIDNYIIGTTGDTVIRAADEVKLQSYVGSENMFVGDYNGSVKLYYDNSEKLRTTATGILLEDSSAKTTAPLQIKNVNSSGVNTNAKLEFYGRTVVGQGSIPYIQSVHGTEAGGSNAANDGGLEFHTRNGGTGTDTMCMHMAHDARVGIRTTTPSHALDVAGDIQIQSTHARLFLTDTNHNPDWSIENENGIFRIKDQTAVTSRLTIDSGGQVNISNKVFLNGGLDTDGDVQFNTGTTNSNILFDASAGALEFTDGNKAVFGTDNDLSIYHDANANINKMHSQKSIENRVKNYYIYTNHHATAHESIMAYGGGAVELTHAGTKKFETTSAGTKVTGINYVTGNLGIGKQTPTQLGGDGGKLLHIAGANNPEIVLERTTSGTEAKASMRVTDLRALTFRVQQGSGTQYDAMHLYSNTGAVELNYEGNKRFLTKSNGFEALGGVYTFYGVEGGESQIQMYADEGDDANDKWRLMAGTDNSWLLGNLSDGSWDNSIKAYGGGAVELYHDDSKKFETTSTGAVLTGRLTTDSITIEDDGSNEPLLHLRADDGSPWAFLISNDNYVSGTQAGLKYYVANNGKAYQQTRGNSSFVEFQLQQSDGSTTNTGLKLNTSRGVELYHQGNKKFETTSTGATVTGTVTATSFSGDGSNLSGISSVGGSTGVDFNDGVQAKFGTDDDLQIYHNGNDGYIQNNTGDLRIRKAGGVDMIHIEQDNDIWIQGNPKPWANNTYDLGTSSYRWRNIYTNDLNLSNEGSSNDVDGSWGNWTIQEGESDLFLKNNRSGKKYKFNLTEVS